MSNYITEAFKQFHLLESENFDLSPEGLDNFSTFMDDAIDIEDEVADVFDLDANADEELKKSYVGKIICDCNVCHSNIFLDKDDIVIDEDDIVNADEDCPYCGSNEGYTIVGEIKPYNEQESEDLQDGDLDVNLDDEEAEEPIEIEDDELEESMKLDGSNNLRGTKNLKRRQDKDGHKNLRGRGNSKISGFNEALDCNIEATKDSSMGNTATIDYYGDCADKANKVAEYVEKHSNFKNEGDTDGSIVFSGVSTKDDFNKFKRLVNKALKQKTMKESLNFGWSYQGDEAYNTYTNSNGDEIEATVYEDGDDWTIGFDFNGEEDSNALKAFGIRNNPGWVYDSMEDAIDGCDSFMDSYLNESMQLSGRKELKGRKTLRHRDDKEGHKSIRGKNNSKISGDLDIHESFENISVDTGDETISIASKDDGGITLDTTPNDSGMEDEFEAPEELGGFEGDEMVAPLSQETQDELGIEEEPSEEDEFNLDDLDDLANDVYGEEGEPEEDVEPEEFDEEEFDNLGESYLKKCYENVKSFNTTKVKFNEAFMVVEFNIKFQSGNNNKTSFVFEAKNKLKNGNLTFEGYNSQINPNNKKAFKLMCSLNESKLVPKSLRYNYTGKNGLNESIKVSGIIKSSKRK